MSHVALIIKSTRLCNLRCTYCHDWASGPGNTMSFGVLLAMTRAVLEDPKHTSVQFIWHGGETTLLSPTWYTRALLLQQRLRRPDQLITNVLQTNGTRLDRDWVRFFTNYRIRVGVSLDGPPQVHDRHRLTRGGGETFAQVAAGLRLLQNTEVPHGVLMVVGEEALALGPRVVFETFLRLGVREYSLLPVKPDNQPGVPPQQARGPWVDPERMSRFLAEYYDIWLEHGDLGIVVRELRSVEGRLSGGNAGICKLAGPCLGQYYLVEPDGEIAHCDLFKGDPAWTLGSVLRNSFAELRASSAMVALRTADEAERQAMSACPEFSVCQGWCPHERYLSRQQRPEDRTDCCGLRPLIEHVRSRMPVAGHA